MFTLNYPIEDKIEINGKSYAVNMSFDNVMRFFDMTNDDELSDADKVEIGVKMFLGASFSCPFEDLEAIYNHFCTSLFLPKESNIQLDRLGNPMPTKGEEEEEIVLCLKHDVEAVYASFIQAYNIDLIEQQGKLHWLKFKALLDGLPEDTALMRIIDIRTRDLPSGKGSEKARQELMKLKKQYALPNSREE